jgi:hypothetical protein
VAALCLTEICRALINIPPSAAYALATIRALIAEAINNPVRVLMGETFPCSPIRRHNLGSWIEESFRLAAFAQALETLRAKRLW